MLNSKLFYLNYMSFANFLPIKNCFIHICETYGDNLKENNINNSSIIVINVNSQKIPLV